MFIRYIKSFKLQNMAFSKSIKITSWLLAEPPLHMSGLLAPWFRKFLEVLHELLMEAFRRLTHILSIFDLTDFRHQIRDTRRFLLLAYLFGNKAWVYFRDHWLGIALRWVQHVLAALRTRVVRFIHWLSCEVIWTQLLIPVVLWLRRTYMLRKYIVLLFLAWEFIRAFQIQPCTCRRLAVSIQ